MHARFGMGLAAAFAASLVAGSVNAQSAAPPPPVAAPPGTQWVWVTLPRLDRNASVEAFEGIKSRDADEDDAWRKLCTEPCGMWIPSGTRLRITGDFRNSGAFALPARPGGVHLAIDPARSGLRITGLIMIPVGGALTLVGGLMYLIADTSSRHGGGSAASDLRVVGAGYGVVGLAAFGAGLALFLTNQKTTVDIRDPNAVGPAALGVRLPRVSLGKGLWLSPEGVQF